MTVTMIMAATPDVRGFFKRKYNGIPVTPARLKKISWRFVRFNATFVLTCVRSFGTGTYAMMHVLLSIFVRYT